MAPSQLNRRANVTLHYNSCPLLLAHSLILFRDKGHSKMKLMWGLITARKRSCGKVMFLQLSVILFRGAGGGLTQCMLGYHSPPQGAGTPPSRHLPAQCMLGDTANKRAVCILLECSLVAF